MARQPYYPSAESLGYGTRSRRRIDARNQADPAVQAGMRGIHRDTKGNVIGGYTAEGQGIGTKGGNWRTPMADVGGMPPSVPVAGDPVAPATPVTTVATPAATVNPNAAPLGQKRSWRDGMATPGTIGGDIGTKPNANGGGLWRWHALNPGAGKFGQKGATPMDAGTATAKLEPTPAPKTPWRRKAVV